MVEALAADRTQGRIERPFKDGTRGRIDYATFYAVLLMVDRHAERAGHP